MDALYTKAIKHGASDFGISHNVNKRFYVVYNERKIHFGSKQEHRRRSSDFKAA